MMATETQPINVAAVASCREIEEWENRARTVNSPALQSATSASQLLNSADEVNRRIALLSFRYRWPVDAGAFEQILAMACTDDALELRLMALSLIYVTFVRSESATSRAAISEAMRRVAELPSQAEEIASSARDYLTIIAGPEPLAEASVGS